MTTEQGALPPLISEVYDTIIEALTDYEYSRSAFYDGDEAALADAERAKRALAYIRTQREQDAGQWQPVENGEYDLGDNNSLSIMGNEEGEEFCCIEANRANGKHESVELDLSMKVCRRVPTPAPVAPQEDAG